MKETTAFAIFAIGSLLFLGVIGVEALKTEQLRQAVEYAKLSDCKMEVKR